MEFRIIAFEHGGVSAWRIENGRALGRNIDFNEYGGGSDDSIRSAANVLARWHPETACELAIEP